MEITYIQSISRVSYFSIKLLMTSRSLAGKIWASKTPGANEGRKLNGAGGSDTSTPQRNFLHD